MNTTVQQLRRFLDLGQKELADLAGCSRHTIESVEQGRLKLSTQLASKIAVACGVDLVWLTANNPNSPMINHEGQPYSRKDYDELTEKKGLESLRFYRVEPEMEIGVAYDLLCRTLKAAHARNQVPQFMHRLEHFVRSEVGRFAKLRDEVYHEIRQWGEENVGSGKSYPKSFLFPRSTEAFERGRLKFKQAITALKEREKAIKK
jgi:DNA-binding XRE family transcriptional regulator